ncbi:polysaccharide deacetylase family protein [Paenibacillus sp. MSJ-34]|uniref:polysaccharide deacetylase family protein n=1 Tax=Paenibacillus sp. MSJ-34 TaxID=2841529 RepID=UPI001C10422E|nr:polysaccharide deacetylase family protein [Paenibacillus sp. MSJ-34]MBU5441480.1 polysaccharide deacetylase family protein [Paenibacillus sp. MSJ-34]
MTKQQVKMGYGENERLLLINADDFGMCHAFNKATKRLLLERAISSATLMVPCPWAKEAASFSRDHPELDVGVHLTFTSEWPLYKWEPTTRSSGVESLRTEEGWMYPDCETFEKNASAEDVAAEISSQIERAIAWGVDPTHLDIHMGSLYGLATGRDFLDSVFDACLRFGLPLRLPRAYAEHPDLPPPLLDVAKQRIQDAERKGIMIIDDLLGLTFQYDGTETYDTEKAKMVQILRGLKPGISEIIIHPGFDTEELRSIMPHAPKRDIEARLFLDEDIRALIAAEGIRMITWRELRDFQRGAGGQVSTAE